jgi:hypothetical protein
MTHSYWKGVLTVVAAAITALVIERAVLPSLAQGDPACGTMASNRACELTGYKLLLNPNAPDLLTLQIETKQGLYSFDTAGEFGGMLGRGAGQDVEAGMPCARGPYAALPCCQ